MGTRALTKVYDENGTMLINMYRQFDGYPDGHGSELAEFLENRVVGNGISSDSPEVFSNGMKDLAAQLVCHFKSDNLVGGIYLYSIGVFDCGEQYTYKIFLGYEKQLKVETSDMEGQSIFNGSVPEFKDWCEKGGEDADEES